MGAYIFLKERESERERERERERKRGCRIAPSPPHGVVVILLGCEKKRWFGERSWVSLQAYFMRVSGVLGLGWQSQMGVCYLCS